MPNEKDDKRSVIDATFIPNEQADTGGDSLDSPIKPPMTAKEFKQHCKRLAEDKTKGMGTRLAAFGLGAATEMILDGIGEVLGTTKKRSPKKLKGGK